MTSASPWISLHKALVLAAMRSFKGPAMREAIIERYEELYGQPLTYAALSMQLQKLIRDGLSRRTSTESPNQRLRAYDATPSGLAALEEVERVVERGRVG